ncbi:MAG: ATP-binding protein [Anaeroplasmataceae bacterium]|nr:ATP-binding protein [Anaeroplasmataceae bacterium]
MSQFADTIRGYRETYNLAKHEREVVNTTLQELEIMSEEYAVLLEAQQLLATVSDNNMNTVLDYITGVINRALQEMFPYDERRIWLDRSTYRGQYPHITVKLQTAEGITRNLQLQAGNGLRQVVSFLFDIALQEIRNGRRLLIMDEVLNGLHHEAKKIISDIIEIFAEEGFQFVSIEYGMTALGKRYLVEKPGKIATITPLDKGTVYNGEVFLFNRPVEEVDKSIMVEE